MFVQRIFETSESSRLYGTFQSRSKGRVCRRIEIQRWSAKTSWIARDHCLDARDVGLKIHGGTFDIFVSGHQPIAAVLVGMNNWTMFPEMAILFVYLRGIVADHRGGVVDTGLLDIFTDLSIDVNDSHRSIVKLQRRLDNQMQVNLAVSLYEDDSAGKIDMRVPHHASKWGVTTLVRPNMRYALLVQTSIGRHIDLPPCPHECEWESGKSAWYLRRHLRQTKH